MATISGAALQQQTATPTLPSKPLPPPLKKPTAPTAPRIDLEPLYSALKSAIGDKWPIYKEACALYLSGKQGVNEIQWPHMAMFGSRLTLHSTGQLNQEELARRIDPFICLDPAREHLHNQLICAIYANTLRDAPEPGVASWVSASDKVTASSKAVTGDAAEQRLKTEIKHLPPRERHRLKQLQDDHGDWLTHTVQEYQRAREMNKLPDIVPTSAGGYNKTSMTLGFLCNASSTNMITDWETEINKRYAQPLFVESHEFPESDTIAARMTPICYEEGLVAGASSGCADFINVAAEAYVKELLADIFARVRTNGANYVQTAVFRKKINREEEGWERGEVKRNAVGLLPCEVEAGAKQRPLNLNDLRIAIELGNNYLNQMRLVSDRIMVGDFMDDDEEPLIEESDASAAKMNGVVLSNGTHDEDEHMIDADGDWTWVGGLANDREQLGSVLEDLLVVGQ